MGAKLLSLFFCNYLYMAIPNGIRRNPSSKKPGKERLRAKGSSPFDIPGEETRVAEIADIVKANEETIANLAALGRNLGAIVNSKKLKDYVETTDKLQSRNKVLEMRKAQEEKKSIKELKSLVKDIAKKTGYSREEVVGQLGDKTSTMYKSLPEEQRVFLSKVIDDKNINMKEAILNNDNKLKEFFGKSLETFKQTMDRNSGVIKASILGPLSLITSPLEDFFGGDTFDVFKGALGKIFSKKDKKRNPTISDLVKNGEMGVLFLWNKIKKKFGEKDDEGNSLLDKFLGKVPIGGLMGALLKGGAIAAIIGSIIWAVADGFAGMSKSGEWGTGKVAGFIGGFLGGTEKGWKGIAKNAGKWAVAGVGAGFLVAGPVGAIVGLLIGAAVGALLGFVGGENIAKGAQKVIDWGKKVTANIWETVKKPLLDTLNWIGSIFTDISGFLVEQFNNAKALFSGDKTIWEFIKDFAKGTFSLIGSLVSDFFNKNPLGKFLNKYLISPIVNFFQGIGDTFDYLRSMSVTELISSIAKGTFESGLETHKKSKKAERLDAAVKGSAEYTAWVKRMGEALRGVSEDRRYQMFTASDQGKAFIEQYNDTHIESIGDGIVRPDGSVIHTDPKDTIIATKNPPLINGKSLSSASGVESSMGGMSETMPVSNNMEKKLDTMITAL